MRVNIVIGTDCNNKKLYPGDKCKFKMKNPFTDIVEDFIGIINYEEDYFAYSFDIIGDDDRIPCVLMKCAEFRSIEKLL